MPIPTTQSEDPGILTDPVEVACSGGFDTKQAAEQAAINAAARAGQMRLPVVIDHAMIERACRAHWPSFDRMRPDHAAEKRVKMHAALSAAMLGAVIRP